MDKAGFKINSRKELENWLKDKPVKWLHLIAVRAALRVFPLVMDDHETLILQTFRSCFISTAALKYPSYDFRKVAIAASAYAAAAGREATNSLAADAAFTASFAGNTISARNSAHIEDVSAAVFISNVKYNSILLRAVEEDAVYLVQHGVTGDLIHQPLWHYNKKINAIGGMLPQWLGKNLFEFTTTKIGELNYSNLIRHWYENLLPIGSRQKSVSFFGEEKDLEIALQPREFWERGEDEASVEAVLADISKIVDGTYEGASSPTQKKVNKKTQKPAERTDVKPKSDEPTAEDELGRRPFAESLVDKINEVREAGQKDGFAVHLHAPWGAGKTSILLMMQDYMKRSAKIEPKDKNWVVVNFNAWEHERRNPPWWPLIEAVERDCSAYLAEQAGIRNNKKPWQEVDDCLKSITQSHFRSSVKSWIGHKFLWCWWKLKTDWLPLVVFLIFGGLIYFLLDKSELITNTPDQSFFMTFLKNLFPLILAAVGLYATFLSATRSMVFGSKDNANYYFQLSNDPLGRIHNLFNKLIDGVDRPVCIFIDDLDRCHADFVVDLLEGIQSSFRHEKVTYVVAADKGWIRSSFENRYDSFKPHVGDAAQPIGYLFLEKIFQMSTPIPGMAAYVKQDYFDHLLDAKSVNENAVESSDDYNERVERAQRSIEEAHPEGVTHDAIKTYISNDPTDVNLAAAVKLVDKSPEAEKQSKHLLSQFARVLSGNPREMKRLLNAFTMRRALSIIQFSDVSMEVLFRWTIIEQSYPALADELIKQPELIEHFTPHSEDPGVTEYKEQKVPETLIPFKKLSAIPKIVNEYGEAPLTAEHIQDITKGA